MTCRASNDYLSLPPFYENKIKGHVSDSWSSLLKLMNISRFSLWRNFSSNFPNATSLDIPQELKEMKQIPMPTLIDYVHDYRKVTIKDQPMSFWAYAVIIFSTVIALGVMIFCYKKCFKDKLQFDCRKRLANCCSDKNVVTGTSTVEESRSVSSRQGEVVSHTPGGQLSFTPDQKEAKVTIASLFRDTRS